MKHNAVPHPLQQPAQSLAAYQEPPRTAVFGCTLRAAHKQVGSTGAGLRDRSRSVEILCLTCSKDCDAARKLGSKLRSHPTPPPRIHICSFYSHVCLPVITPCASMATAMAAAIIGVASRFSGTADIYDFVSLGAASDQMLLLSDPLPSIWG